MSENALQKDQECLVEFQPQEGQFVVLVLSERGAESFTYLNGAQSGQRAIYFIDRISKGSITQATMLLGQFIFELEGAPMYALLMTPGCTNRIYFPQDKRVDSYDVLTTEEKEVLRNRLMLLAEKYPQYADKIKDIISKI